MRKNLGDFNIFNTFLDTYSEITWSIFLKVSSSKKFLKIFDMEIFRWIFLRTHGISIFLEVFLLV